MKTLIRCKKAVVIKKNYTHTVIMSDKYIKTKDLCVAVKSHFFQQEDIRKIFHFIREKYSKHGIGIIIPPTWDKIYVESLYKPLRFAKGMRSIQTSCALSFAPERLKISNLQEFLQKYCFSWIDDDRLASSAQFWGHITLESVKLDMSEQNNAEKNKKMCTSLLTKGACNIVLDGQAPINQLGYLLRAEEELRKVQTTHNSSALDIPRGEYKIFTNCLDYGAIRVYSHTFNENEFDEDGRDGKIPKYITRKDDNNIEYKVFTEQYNKIMTKKKHLYIYSPTSNKGKTQMMQQILMECNAAEITDPNNFAGVSPFAQFYVMDEYDHNHKFSFDALKRFTGGVASSFSGNIKSYGKSFTPRQEAQLILFSNIHIFGIYGEWCPKLQRHFMNPLHADILENRFHIFKVDPSHGSLEDDVRSYKHPSTWNHQELNAEIRKLFMHYIGGKYLHVPQTDRSKQYAAHAFLKKLKILVSMHHDGESPHKYIPSYALPHLPMCDIVEQRLGEADDIYSTIMF